MAQSIKYSWIEAIVSTVTSTIGTYVVQWVVYPLIGIEADNGQLWLISLLFGGLNTLKTFVVRRVFNKLEKKNGSNR